MWTAVRGDAASVLLDHRHELLVRLQALPAQALLAAYEEGPRTALGALAPQLVEGLFHQNCSAACSAAFDVAAIGALQVFVFVPLHMVQCSADR